MKDHATSPLLSASALMRFTGCPHAITLDMAWREGADITPRADTEDAELLQKKGDAHEAAHLERLRAAGKHVVEIPRSGDLGRDAEATRAALARGADVIFQGAFLSGRWGGWSDFLERVETPSALGPFSYEVADTKLKTRAVPTHVLQLVLYSDLLAEVQGVAPARAHLELGSGERVSLRLADYGAYARAARGRLEDFLAERPETRPVPCADCALCRWQDHCAASWAEQDSLFRVAGIARGQVKKLEAAGIRSMAALAGHDGPVRGLAPATREKLTAQARLQHARKSGAPAFELKAPEPGRGFALLPRPDPGDVFYDIEGDPHHEGGLEYLHGVRADGAFRGFWAHDHAQEAEALRGLLAFLRDRLARFPEARIYHYAPYEITALRRLTAKHGIGEAFLDRLLRERRFVDLYAVVRGGLVCSEPDYSIKSLEVFTGIDRAGEVTTAGGSVVAYERWRETREQAILDEIEDYNRIDCLSTERLRDWLVSIRPDIPWPELAADAAAQEVEEDAAAAFLAERLAASGLDAERQAALFDLARFHAREKKPAWWAIFDSLGKDDDELIDDMGALAGLEALGPRVPVKSSQARTYRFPEQETKIAAGKTASVADPEGVVARVTVTELDPAARTVTLKVGNARAHLLAARLTLHPEPPLSTEVLERALADVVADQCGPVLYRALDDLLARRAPHLAGGPDTDILGPGNSVAGTIRAIHRMQETVLLIQGPPGTGKTHVAARAILSLVRAGHRVGVSSNSHAAIRNVFMGCLRAMEEEDLPLTLDLVHKVSDTEDGYDADAPVRRTTDNAEAAAGGHVVGGTAFFFAREENVQAFDWLFVDEAGQVSLANLVAMGRAARNIVLVGDPRQLPQVIQGAHPHPANLSCLDWALGDHATIPPDRGIFLPESRRMHPDICRNVSELFYEGRLAAHAATARQALAGTPFPASGAHFVPVEHEGNTQVAPEEIAAIAQAVRDLLRGNVTDQTGTTRPMRASDILVVAPYNAQVNALRAALPDAVRVGTVDRFQGQEAPVCLVSMTASSAEDIPRGMEFLYSPNRLNVALSRAQTLALVFASPRLRAAKCNTLEQVRMVNALCAIPSTRPTGPDA